MPSVVILHAADDALPARALGEKLRQIALTPVIEKAAGEERQNAVKNAALAIALWSPRSLADAGVTADAEFARGKGKLVHACMQSVRPPGAFAADQAVDLTGWRGEDDFQAWRELALLVADKAGVPPPPEPPPRPPSGFFQPGRPAAAADPVQPQPRAQAPASTRASAPPSRAASHAPARPSAPTASPEPARKSGGPNMALIGIITFLVVAIGGGAGYYFFSQNQGGGADAAWAQVDQNDPRALRAFLAGEPGARRGQAQTALEALEERRYAEARRADTIEALEAFLTDFPGSEEALAARGRIAELRALPEPPASEQAPGQDAAPAAPADPDLLPPGASAPAPQPAPPPATSGGPVVLQPAPEPATETPTQPQQPDE